MTTLKALQKEFKAYDFSDRAKSAKVFCIVYYQDRIVVLGYQNSWLESFFNSRGVVAHEDRGGWSIDAKDAIKLGLTGIDEADYQYGDSRKKP